MSDPWKEKRVIGNISSVLFSGFDGSVFVLVYCIETDGGVVYVGSTAQPIRQRLRAHIADANHGSDLPIHKWMREARFNFRVRLLEVVLSSERVTAERKWMASFGRTLLNLTDCGPGMSGHKFAGTEHAKRIGAAIRTGSNFPCETCGAIFWRKRRDISKGHNRFCTRGCYQKWQIGKSKKAAA